jgi:hypothetical protein
MPVAEIHLDEVLKGLDLTMSQARLRLVSIELSDFGTVP